VSTDLFSITSVEIAASLEKVASEIAAAAKLYQRMPVHRDDLAVALGSLVEALDHHMGVFTRKRDEEAAHAPQK
jgi:hypothetical protein